MRLLFLIFLLASCASQPPAHLYSLDLPVETNQVASLLPATISVGRPTVQPGYDTAMMAYQMRPHEIDYFSRNRWVDTPGRMLYPILIDVLSHQFATVARAPSRGAMRLDTDIVLFRQEFSGDSSRIHIVLRARINREGKVFSRSFEIFENCPSNAPYGGVIAANQAVSRLVQEISDFAVSAAKAY